MFHFGECSLCCCWSTSHYTEGTISQLHYVFDGFLGLQCFSNSYTACQHISGRSLSPEDVGNIFPEVFTLVHFLKMIIFSKLRLHPSVGHCRVHSIVVLFKCVLLPLKNRKVKKKLSDSKITVLSDAVPLCLLV